MDTGNAFELIYEGDQDKWLQCVCLAEKYFDKECAKEKAGIVFLRTSLLPLWKPEEVIKELFDGLDGF